MLNSKTSQNIFLCLFFLSGFGLVQVYSTSFLFATEQYGDGLFFFKKQLLFTVAAWTSFFILALIPWKYNRSIGMLLWFFSVLILVFTLFPQTSVSVGGSRRWIELPFGFRFQPSELLKITTPFLLAWLVVLKEKWPLQNLFFWLVPFFALAFPTIILIFQPDFGTVILLFALVFALVFVLGVPWVYFLFGLSSFLGLVYYLISSQYYRSARWEAFLNPWGGPLRNRFSSNTKSLGDSLRRFFWCGIGKRTKQVVFSS